MKHLLLVVLGMLSSMVFSQSEKQKIESTIKNYMEGTSYNNIPKIESAFINEANLFLSNEDKDLWIVPISEYVSWYKNKKHGEFNGRLGGIISIDRFNNIATAKAEILMPNTNFRFVDMFLLKKIEGEWKIISKTADREASNKTGEKILFVVSNTNFYGKTDYPSGNSFAEIVNAYDKFKKAGYEVDFVSPNGGSVPLAYINTSSHIDREYVYNQDFMYKLENTALPKDIEAINYKAVYYVGGGSVMFDIPENKDIQRLSQKIYENNGVISAVCHGTAGIVNLRDNEGAFLYSGKNVNGYPDEYERKNSVYYKSYPLNIQKTIEERGGVFKYSEKNKPYVQVDGRLITGQNYLSAGLVAEKIIEVLRSSPVQN